MAVTKQDILNDLQLVKKGLQEIEFYIRNYTNEENISKGVNGVIDYVIWFIVIALAVWAGLNLYRFIRL